MHIIPIIRQSKRNMYVHQICSLSGLHCIRQARVNVIKTSQIRTYYAENTEVDVIAATESFADNSLVDYEFLVTAVPKTSLRERYRHQL